MARFILRSALPTSPLTVLVCLAFVIGAPIAKAQRGGHPVPVGGGHPGGGGRVVAPHVAVPPVSHSPILHAPILPPRGVLRPPVIHVGTGVANFGFRRRLFPIRNPVFIFVPFLGFRQNFNSLWWLNCGVPLDWEYGCGNWFFYPYSVENNVAPPWRQENPATVYQYYVGGEQQLVDLFLKDGTTIAVTDYWFVNDEVHFMTPDEDGTKSEQTIGLDELDLQKTINVNTRRGFRFVRRDEPMDQWVRDHPNADPPLVQPPQKN